MFGWKSKKDMALFVLGILKMMLKAEYLIILCAVNVWWTVNGDGHTPSVVICGLVRPKYMNNSTHKCVAGEIVPRTKTTTMATKQPKTTTIPQTPTSCRNSFFTDDDILFCNRKPYCGRSVGYKCCGFGRYHPQYQTCCRENSATYSIHNNMPEKEYICCGLQAYRRGSPEVPCSNPSLNDRFFNKPISSNPRNMSLKQLELVCKSTLHAFSVQIIGQTNSTAEDRKLHAKLSMWNWNPTFRRQPTQEKDMEIPLDMYSPGKKTTDGKTVSSILKLQLSPRRRFLSKDLR